MGGICTYRYSDDLEMRSAAKRSASTRSPGVEVCASGAARGLPGSEQKKFSWGCRSIPASASVEVEGWMRWGGVGWGGVGWGGTESGHLPDDAPMKMWRYAGSWGSSSEAM